LEAFEALGSRRRVAEAAGPLDVLRRGVVLARETEHGAGHLEAGGLRGLWHMVALVPGGVMGAAAGDLDPAQAKLVHEALQFRDGLHLQRPAADTDGQRGNAHGRSSVRQIEQTAPSAHAKRSDYS